METQKNQDQRFFPGSAHSNRNRKASGPVVEAKSKYRFPTLKPQQFSPIVLACKEFYSFIQKEDAVLEKCKSIVKTIIKAGFYPEQFKTWTEETPFIQMADDIEKAIEALKPNNECSVFRVQERICYVEDLKIDTDPHFIFIGVILENCESKRLKDIYLQTIGKLIYQYDLSNMYELSDFDINMDTYLEEDPENYEPEWYASFLKEMNQIATPFHKKHHPDLLTEEPFIYNYFAEIKQLGSKPLNQLKRKVSRYTAKNKKERVLKKWCAAAAVLMQTHKFSLNDHIFITENMDYPVTAIDSMSVHWDPGLIAFEGYEELLNDRWGNNGVAPYSKTTEFVEGKGLVETTSNKNGIEALQKLIREHEDVLQLWMKE